MLLIIHFNFNYPYNLIFKPINNKNMQDNVEEPHLEELLPVAPLDSVDSGSDAEEDISKKNKDL